MPSVEKVQLLAQYLGVSTSDLLGEKPTGPRDKNESGPAAGADPLRSILLENFDQLNQEGRERLVETSDDMVNSGKYKKTGQVFLGGEKMA